MRTALEPETLESRPKGPKSVNLSIVHPSIHQAQSRRQTSDRNAMGETPPVFSMFSTPPENQRECPRPIMARGTCIMPSGTIGHAYQQKANSGTHQFLDTIAKQQHSGSRSLQFSIAHHTVYQMPKASPNRTFHSEDSIRSPDTDLRSYAVRRGERLTAPADRPFDRGPACVIRMPRRSARPRSRTYALWTAAIPQKRSADRLNASAPALTPGPCSGDFRDPIT